MEAITHFVIWAIFVLLLVMFLGPPVTMAVLYLADRGQQQHAVIRNFPILGRLRYLPRRGGGIKRGRLPPIWCQFDRSPVSGDIESAACTS